MKAEKNKIVKAGKSEVALTAPEEIMGFEEGFHEGELIIPRCKVMQPTSPELLENDALRPGNLVNSVTLERVEGTFTPILKQSTWIRFNQRKRDDPGFDPNYAPGGIIWRSNDPNSDKVKVEGSFGEDGTPPLATKFLNVFALFEGQSMPLVISFAKTSFKTGRQLLTLARFSGEKAFFSRKYQLTTKGEQDAKSGGNYFILLVKSLGKSSEEEFNQCLDIYKTLSTRQDVKIHEEEKGSDEEIPFA